MELEGVNGCVWLRIGTLAGSCEHDNESSGLHKVRGNALSGLLRTLLHGGLEC
jgi:hypothetical protein